MGDVHSRTWGVAFGAIALVFAVGACGDDDSNGNGDEAGGSDVSALAERIQTSETGDFDLSDEEAACMAGVLVATFDDDVIEDYMTSDRGQEVIDDAVEDLDDAEFEAFNSGVETCIDFEALLEDFEELEGLGDVDVEIDLDLGDDS
jgi:hypothetical protein